MGEDFQSVFSHFVSMYVSMTFESTAAVLP